MIYIILLYGAIHIILFFLSWSKITSGKKNIVEFISRLAYPIGAFVWEDLLVFSLFNVFLVIFSLFTHDLRIGILFFLVFWAVRGAGETLYFFLQQFILPKHYPHHIDDKLWPLKKIFGNISNQQCYILLQVTFQTITIISIGLIFLLFINWHDIDLLL